MCDNHALALIILLNLIFLSPISLKIVRGEHALRKEERQIERTAEYHRKIIDEAQRAMEVSSRIRALHDRLALLPRDGTDRRNMERSKILRDILVISKSKMVAQGIILLSEQESHRGRKHVGKVQERKV